MGAKVEIFNQVLYLTTAAIDWYERNNISFTILKDNINDDIINIFQMSNAVTLKEGATYQQLLNYYLLIGMLREDAVAKAQSQIGISKETLIETLDILQTDIISDKAAKIIAAEESIKEQTNTQKTTFEEIDLSKFGDSAPKIETETSETEILRSLPKTDGDISGDFLDYITLPVDTEEKTKEVSKIEIVKPENEPSIITIKSDSQPTDFKSFGVNVYTIAGTIIIIGVITGTVLYLKGKKK